MRVSDHEIRTTREVVRELLSILDLLEGRDVEKIVVMQGSKMRAVIISPAHYEALTEAAD